MDSAENIPFIVPPDIPVIPSLPSDAHDTASQLYAMPSSSSEAAAAATAAALASTAGSSQRPFLPDNSFSGDFGRLHDPSPPRKLSRKKRHFCQCGKSFSTSRYLNEHKRLKHGPGTVRATPAALQSQSTPAKMAADAANTHTFACSVPACDGRTFSSRAHLLQHIYSIHEKRKYKCPFRTVARGVDLSRLATLETAGATGSSSQSLHAMFNAMNAAAEVCGAEFTDPSHLRRHMKTNHGKSRLPAAQLSQCTVVTERDPARLAEAQRAIAQATRRKKEAPVVAKNKP